MNMVNQKSFAPAGVELSARAMLAYVNIRQWSGRRLDRRVTEETNRAHNAQSDAGRYNKLLISKEHVTELNRIAGRARADLYYYSSPWLDTGGRILPASLYDQFMAEMAKHKAGFEKAAAKFVSAYPDMIEESRVRLNGMFDESDYPPADEIARRFYFDVTVMPMPESGDFRIDRHDSDAIRADIEKKTNEAIAAAMRDTWQRIAESVATMAEKLRNYKPAAGEQKAENVFRDSLVSNLDNLVSILPGLNIANDPAMAKITECMQAHLSGLKPGELRENHALRSETVRKAEVIQKAVSQFMA